MNFAAIDARLLSHPGAMKALHEKWGWMVYWVGGKQFACKFTTNSEAKPPYANRHLLSLRCSPERNMELRAEFPDVILPAYYSDGHTWISIDLDAVDNAIPKSLVLELCDLSYANAFINLTKKQQWQVFEEEYKTIEP